MRTLLLSTSLMLAFSIFGQANSYPNGSTVANFTITDTDGNTFSLYDITAQGKHVLLDFFFAACPPCQQTQPHFNALYETYGCNAHDLFLVSINNGNDNNAQVVAYEATYGGPTAHSPAVSNEGGGQAVAAAFGIPAYPTYCLIGPDNIMKNQDIWPVDNMQTFVNAFPTNSNIQPAACTVVGIDELRSGISAQVYPSPSAGLMTIEVEALGSGRVAMDVIDAMGRIVHQQDLGVRGAEGFTEVMDLGALQNGNYILRLLHNDTPASVHNIIIVH